MPAFHNSINTVTHRPSDCQFLDANMSGVLERGGYCIGDYWKVDPFSFGYEDASRSVLPPLAYVSGISCNWVVRSRDLRCRLHLQSLTTTGVVVF